MVLLTDNHRENPLTNNSLLHRRGGIVGGKSVKFNIQFRDTLCDSTYAVKVVVVG